MKSVSFFSISLLLLASGPEAIEAQKRVREQQSIQLSMSGAVEAAKRARIKAIQQGDMMWAVNANEAELTKKIRSSAASTNTVETIEENLANDDPKSLLVDIIKDQVYYKEGELIYNCHRAKDALSCARNMQAYAEDVVTSDWRYQSGRLVYKCQPYKANGKIKKSSDIFNDCDDGIAGLADSLSNSYEVRAAAVAKKYGADKYVLGQYSWDITYKCTGSKQPDKCALGVFDNKFEGIHHDAKKVNELRQQAEREALNGVNNANREIFKAAREAESKVKDIGNKALDGINKGAGKMKSAGKKLGRKIKKIF